MTSGDGVGTWRVGIKRIKIAVIVLLLAGVAGLSRPPRFANAQTFVNAVPTATSGATLTLPVPPGTQQNMYMVAGVVGNQSGAFEPNAVPTGWTLLPTTNCVAANTFPNAEVALCTYYHCAGASEPASYAWSWSAASKPLSGAISVWNVGTCPPTPDTSISGGPNGATQGLQITTSAANDFMLKISGFVNGGIDASSCGSGTTESFLNSGSSTARATVNCVPSTSPGFWIGDEVLGAPGAQPTETFDTTPGAQDKGSILSAFLADTPTPSPSPTPTPTPTPTPSPSPTPSPTPTNTNTPTPTPTATPSPSPTPAPAAIWAFP